MFVIHYNNLTQLQLKSIKMDGLGNDNCDNLNKTNNVEENVSEAPGSQWGKENSDISNDAHSIEGFSPTNDFTEEKPSRLEENTTPSIDVAEVNNTVEDSPSDGQDNQTFENIQEDLRSRSSVYSSTGSTQLIRKTQIKQVFGTVFLWGCVTVY